MWEAKSFKPSMVLPAFVMMAGLAAAPLQAAAQGSLVDNLNRYSIITYTSGVEYYADRTFTVTSLSPELDGLFGIQTANDDKGEFGDTGWITFDAVSNLLVYIGYDKRAIELPAWLDNNFTETDLEIVVTDGSASPLRVFVGAFEAGSTVDLGGNRAVPSSGADSNYIVLFTEAPVFLEQPQPQSVPAGFPASFSAALTFPVDPVSYQWQLDQVNIPDATNQTYEIPAVAPMDEGNYRVVVTDASKGMFTSDEAFLGVVGGVGMPVSGATGVAILAAGLCVGGALFAFKRKQ